MYCLYWRNSMRFIFFSSLLFFCFCVLGNSLCKNSIVKLYKQVETAVTGRRDLAVLDRVGKNLLEKYTENPDQFLNTFRENINSEDIFERKAVLDVIKYMQDPPLEVQRLIVEKLEDPDLSVRDVAYRTLMVFDIEDLAILQKLEEKRRKGDGMEKILARRVLEIQENKAQFRR